MRTGEVDVSQYDISPYLFIRPPVFDSVQMIQEQLHDYGVEWFVFSFLLADKVIVRSNLPAARLYRHWLPNKGHASKLNNKLFNKPGHWVRGRHQHCAEQYLDTSSASVLWEEPEQGVVFRMSVEAAGKLSDDTLDHCLDLMLSNAPAWIARGDPQWVLNRLRPSFTAMEFFKAVILATSLDDARSPVLVPELGSLRDYIESGVQTNTTLKIINAGLVPPWMAGENTYVRHFSG